MFARLEGPARQSWRRLGSVREESLLERFMANIVLNSYQWHMVRGGQDWISLSFLALSSVSGFLLFSP